MKKFGLVILLLSSVLSLNSQNLKPNTTGSFIYNTSNSKSITVFYHIPNGDITTMPILMSFHGVNRNAADYRDYWISMANNKKFMVFAPEFSDVEYPGGDSYNLANIFDDGDNPSSATFNSKKEWTISEIDFIFNQIVTAISGTQQKYNAWGHSAGAQFLHRLAMYLPNSKLDIAVCSNAGWYTVPEFTVDFPYGLKKGELPNADLTTAFSKKMIVHLGTADTNANDAGLRHNNILDNQQGLNRFVRGKYFFNESKATAKSINATYNWEKYEVSNVGHNARLMANDALQHVLKSTLSTTKYLDDKQVILYPNPVKDNLFFDNSNLKLSKIAVYSIQGKLISTFHFNKYSSNQNINLSKLAKGIYFLKEKNFVKKIIKE